VAARLGVGDVVLERGRHGKEGNFSFRDLGKINSDDGVQYPSLPLLSNDFASYFHLISTAETDFMCITVSSCLLMLQVLKPANSSDSPQLTAFSCTHSHVVGSECHSNRSTIQTSSLVCSTILLRLLGECDRVIFCFSTPK
jgi:hypothetical protein